MSSIKKNILANLIGKIWGAGIIILLIPVYIKYLGIESYGLIGFYGTLISSMAILDLGLSTTIKRELAKYNSENISKENIRDLTFSLECIYWFIGIIICCLVLFLSGFISTHWVKTETLPLSVVKNSVMLMGVVIAFQWPITLYDGGLTGLEKQVLNNIIAVIMTTLRAGGIIIIFRYFSPTLETFFIWQASISFLYVLIMKWALWKEMPVHNTKLKFSNAQIKIIWRFAAGMTGISVITFFLSQIDKIVLSKILPLSQFGYYTLAFTMASSIGLVVMPVSITFFPRFAALVAAKKNEELKTLYHQACRLISTLVFPLSFIILFFTKDILRIWTKSATTTDNTYLLTQILIVGSTFNALMIIPYNLLIASGRTRFTIYQNTIAAIILVPMLFLWTRYYGAIGAAFIWVIVNAGYILISQPLMHRILLKNELLKWYLNDTLLPMLPSLLIVILVKFSLQFLFPYVTLNLITLACISIIVLGTSIISYGRARGLIKNAFINLSQNGNK